MTVMNVSVYRCDVCRMPLLRPRSGIHLPQGSAIIGGVESPNPLSTNPNQPVPAQGIDLCLGCFLSQLRTFKVQLATPLVSKESQQETEKTLADVLEDSYEAIGETK